MVMDAVMDVVAKYFMLEGAMVETHANFPAGAEYLWQTIVYTL